MGIGTGNPDVLNNPQARAERGACITCSVWGDCLFHLKKLGGFKGNHRWETNGRHNVGYGLRTDAVEKHNSKEDFCSCENFVTNLQNRMLDGDDLRMRGGKAGKGAEIVRIIGQEGDTIKQTTSVGFNSRGEVIKPQPQIIQALRDAGYKVNTEDQSPAVPPYREVEIERVIPKFKHQSQTSSEFSDGASDRLLERVAREEAAADVPWSEMRKAPVDDEEEEITEGVEVAQPIKRGPGRPRKVDEA